MIPPSKTSVLNTSSPIAEKPNQPIHSALGVHILLECSGCRPALLTDATLLESTLVNAAQSAGATVVDSLIHQFNPHGLSGVVVIAESHIAVHTWPEQDYAAIDIFTCGMPEIAEKIQHHVLAAFQPKNSKTRTIERTPPEASATQ